MSKYVWADCSAISSVRCGKLSEFQCDVTMEAGMAEVSRKRDPPVELDSIVRLYEETVTALMTVCQAGSLAEVWDNLINQSINMGQSNRTGVEERDLAHSKRTNVRLILNFSIKDYG